MSYDSVAASPVQDPHAQTLGARAYISSRPIPLFRFQLPKHLSRRCLRKKRPTRQRDSCDSDATHTLVVFCTSFDVFLQSRAKGYYSF